MKEGFKLNVVNDRGNSSCVRKGGFKLNVVNQREKVLR